MDNFRTGFEVPKWIRTGHPARLQISSAQLKLVLSDSAYKTDCAPYISRPLLAKDVDTRPAELQKYGPVIASLSDELRRDISLGLSIQETS